MTAFFVIVLAISAKCASAVQDDSAITDITFTKGSCLAKASCN